MKKFLAVLVVLLIVVGVVGFYRGWFTVTREAQPEETNVNLKIDKEKIEEDKEAAANKFKEIRDDIRGSGEPAEGESAEGEQ